MKIVDTYAEASDGIYSRILITADDNFVLKKAANDVSSTPSAPIGKTEAGIEKWVDPSDTPDGRPGVIVQVWASLEKGKPFNHVLSKFEKFFSYRIRQNVLIKPFTAIFDACPNPEGTIDTLDRIGHCGDGYEWEETKYNRKIMIVPIMVPDFTIERYLGFKRGVMGGNFWYMCKEKKTVMKAGMQALEAISKVNGVITPYWICSAGSKVETKYPQIGGTTNHPYCSSLKERLMNESKVPDGVNFIPEIVIHGVSLDAVKNAMKVGIESILDFDDVVSISAGNFGGELGKYQIYLKELFNNKGESNNNFEKIEDESYKKAEEEKKARRRIKGPYRKAYTGT